ncbi:hypothetical protein VNI00_017369 [Paramarasmius palmivorus]|uniref:F-box domain-containing protein n=1 Tax=Paramarasmius palmivorus TaxID=297713 RepID=A0AAW0B5K8_9AGAR
MRRRCEKMNPDDMEGTLPAGPFKHRKLGSENGKSEAKVRKRTTRGKLHKLVIMPLDILYMIYDGLNPRTFVALLYINRAFRDMISSSRGISIWIAKRKECLIPEPLPGLSELEWAILLLGQPICQVCASKSRTAQRNWTLQQWICEACCVNKEITFGDIQNKYANGITILSKNNTDLAEIAIQFDWWRSLSTWTYDRFSSLKISVIMTEVVDRGNSGILGTFLEQRKQETTVLRNRIRNGIDWITDEATPLLTSFVSPESKQWRELRPRVLDNLLDLRRKHVIEDSPLFCARRQLVFQAYLKYKHTLLPPKWLALPSYEAICLFQPITEKLVALESVRLTEDDFTEPIVRIQSQVQEWICDQRRKLTLEASNKTNALFDTLHKVHGIYAPETPIEDIFPGIHEFDLSKESYCNLAIAQIVLEFSDTAVLLVHLSGLDIREATADEMDERGDFFRCLTCAEGNVKYHDLNKHPTGPRFEILEGEDIREDNRKCWTCCRCNAHIESLATRREVKGHLLHEHGIMNANIPSDFAYGGRY